MSEQTGDRSPWGLTLDRSQPTWRGTFPGLGTVLVAPNGEVSVAAAAPDPTGELAAALAHGWGDLLSLARRGHRFLLGAALQAPGGGAVIVAGVVPDVAAVTIALLRHGWAVISDRPAPAVWRGQELVAVPRATPVLVARERAGRAGLEFEPVRASSNAVAIDVPRASQAQPVGCVVFAQRRRPHERVLEELTGHRKFERMAGLVAAGALAAQDDADANGLDEHLRLSQIPAALLRIGPAVAVELDEFLAWRRP